MILRTSFSLCMLAMFISSFSCAAEQQKFRDNAIKRQAKKAQDLADLQKRVWKLEQQIQLEMLSRARRRREKAEDDARMAEAERRLAQREAIIHQANLH